MKFEGYWIFEKVAHVMIETARTSPRYNGISNEANSRLLDRLRFIHVSSGTVGIFSFDQGHHSSGWWKNPEYERCWHLSLSFFDPVTSLPRDKDWHLTEKWLSAFYHDNVRFVWSEPPYSKHGKPLDVWHYRVFCDPAWEPIIPRGEVYNKTLTEAGWLSFSDLQDARAKSLQKLTPLPGEQ